MRAIVGGVLLALVGLVGESRAEDVGTVMAALSDPGSECRYLHRLQSESRTATELANRLRGEFDTAMARAKSQVFMPDYKSAKDAAISADAARTVAYEKLKDYNDAKRVLQAKRGNDDPCPVREDEKGETTVSASPPPQQQTTVDTPTSGSLEERLRALKEKRAKGEVSPEEYYEQRSKLLEGL